MRQLVLVVLVLAMGCGNHPGGGGGDDGTGSLEGLVSLTVTPADQTLVIQNEQPAISNYTATGTFDDGRVEDISALVQFNLADATLGSFQASALTTTVAKGGKTDIVATAGAISGSTGVTIRLEQTYRDPGATLPADPAAPFGGTPDAARAPALVYPNDGVLVPPNLGRLEVHFRP